MTLPAFPGVSAPADLHGRMHIGPRSTTSSARSMHRSTARCRPNRTSTSRCRRSHDPSLAPPGTHVHVRLRAVRALPTGSTVTGTAKRVARWSRHRPAHAGTVRAGHLEQLVEHRQVITPVDLEQEYRPHRRPHLPRRAVARSAVHDAADTRMGAVPRRRSPGSILCGAGTHPGRRHHGRPGPERRARDSRSDLKR